MLLFVNAIVCSLYFWFYNDYDIIDQDALMVLCYCVPTGTLQAG